jgi:predicted CXXCH cytochrome family protein
MKRLWYRVQGGPLFVIGMTVLLILVVGSFAHQQPVMAGPPEQGGEDHTGQPCAECHLDYKAVWETGVHAIAYDRESFQEAWAATDNDQECLICHTTDYQPHDGSFLAENVQCEACHGQNEANHPPQEFVVNRAPDACGDCHTTTFDEWRRSPHAFTEDMGTVACSTCHNPHGQTLRFEETNELCLNCHQSAPNTYVHLTHNEVDYENVEVTCASCHMYRSPDDEHHEIPDHIMSVETVPCTDCHEALSIQGNVPLLVDVDAALAEERDELREQVTELEAVLENQLGVEAEGGVDFVQLTQGLIAGLGIGLTAAWVILRRENDGNENE